MKTVGIIGGFGPETTAKFQLNIIDRIAKSGIDHRPGILTWNTPIPRLLERQLILQNQGLEKYLPFILEAVRRLEAGGADFLVMPCNSLHALEFEIRQATKLPLISIINETTLKIKNGRFKRLGLIATTCSINHQIYHNPLKKLGVEIITPSNQSQIDQSLSNIVNNSGSPQPAILQALSQFEIHSANAVIFGCTDIQLLHIEKNLPIIDSFNILVEASVREILS